MKAFRSTFFACAALIGASSANAVAQSTARVSTSPVDTQGNFHSLWGAVSADGRYAAFQSTASNLVLSDPNGHMPDVFVKDMQTGATTLASVSSTGAAGDSGSIAPSLSADGRWLAFESDATNFVTGDTNALRDVFVRDLQSGTTERVSVSSAAGEGDGASHRPVLSADGRWVAFESDAANLVAGDTNGVTDVFLHDRTTGVTERVSTSTAGAEGNGASTRPALAAGGGFVAFTSVASNFVSGDANGLADVFFRDLSTGIVELVSVSSAGAQGDLGSRNPSFSSDGRLVAFESDASNLVAGDTNGFADVFVRDRLAGSTERSSVDSSGAQASGPSLLQGTGQLSADGRWVSFDSGAANLVAGDTNAGVDCFVHDRLTGSTTRASVTSAGLQAGGGSRAPAITPDGRYVVFESPASNLVPGDTNLYWDVFRRDRGIDDPAYFCFGDGTATACPCGNHSAPGAGEGCVSSFGAGARLRASGRASVGADTLLLLGSSMPDASALYFQGTARANGGLGSPFGDGLRCAVGTVIRLGTRTNVAGTSQYPSGGDVAVSVRGLVAAGDVRHYQIWYRNAAAWCQPETHNLSNGCTLAWQP